MSTAAEAIELHALELATGTITYMERGSGPHLLLLHHDIGSTGWGEFHDLLAAKFHVVAMNMPGYGGSKRLEWARHPRDLAGVALAAARKLGLHDIHLVGLGFGGWIAAEMASFAANDFATLSLVAPAGLKPERTFVLDQVMMDYPDYVAAGFSSPDVSERYFPREQRRTFKERFDENREVVARIAWKPYMYSYELPELLREMRVPTLVAWGTADRVIPVECAERYAEVLPDCTLRYIEAGSHFLDLEHPGEIASYIIQHAGIAGEKE